MSQRLMLVLTSASALLVVPFLSLVAWPGLVVGSLHLTTQEHL